MMNCAEIVVHSPNTPALSEGGSDKLCVFGGERPVLIRHSSNTTMARHLLFKLISTDTTVYIVWECCCIDYIVISV